MLFVFILNATPTIFLSFLSKNTDFIEQHLYYNVNKLFLLHVVFKKNIKNKNPKKALTIRLNFWLLFLLKKIYLGQEVTHL